MFVRCRDCDMRSAESCDIACCIPWCITCSITCGITCCITCGITCGSDMGKGMTAIWFVGFSALKNSCVICICNMVEECGGSFFIRSAQDLKYRSSGPWPADSRRFSINSRFFSCRWTSPLRTVATRGWFGGVGVIGVVGVGDRRLFLLPFPLPFPDLPSVVVGVVERLTGVVC